MSVVIFPGREVVDFWIDQAEFATKHLRGYGYFYGTSRQIPAIREYIVKHVVRHGELPLGSHIVTRPVGLHDSAEWEVTFPVVGGDVMGLLAAPSSGRTAAKHVPKPDAFTRPDHPVAAARKPARPVRGVDGGV